LQREVADYVGIERTTYSAYEEDGRDYHPIETQEHIAGLYGVDIKNKTNDIEGRHLVS